MIARGPRGIRVGRVGAMLSALVSGQMIVRAGGLLLVPLFLHRWSATRYGEWLALSAVAGYLALLDPALHLAAVNALTQRHAQDDVAGFQRIQRAALTASVLLASLGSLMLIGLALTLPLGSWLRLTAPAHDVALVVFLLGAGVLWAMPARLLFGTYQALGNGARSQWVVNLQQIAGVPVAALVLLLGGGMVALALGQVAITSVATAAVAADLRRHARPWAPRLSLAGLGHVREVLRPSAFFSMLSWANLVMQQGSVLLVSGALGGTTVALFSVSRTVASVPRFVLDALTWAFWPEVARVEASAGAPALRLVHKALVALAIVIVTAFTAGLWYEGTPLIGLWTGGRLEGDLGLLRLLLTMAVLQAPWLASGLITMAANRHQTFAVGYLSGAVLGMTLAWALIDRVGLLAVPLGLIVGEAVGGYHFTVRATCRMLEEPYAPFALRLWSTVGGLAVAGVAIAAGVHGMAAPSPVRAALAALLTALLALPLVWWSWLEAGERERLTSRVRDLGGLLPPALAWRGKESE